MQRLIKVAFLSATLIFSLAASPAWNPEPWLDDLRQIRTAIDRDYPNREWLTEQREVSLDRWFQRAADAIRQGQDDYAARAALNSLIERFNDGHVALRWPSPPASTAQPAPSSTGQPPTPSAFCAARGYDASQVSKGTGATLPGYRSVDVSGPFRVGLVDTGTTLIGVLRIGVFSPQGYPTLCEQAVTNMRIAIGKPCDETCEDRLLTEAYALMTRGLIDSVEQIRIKGAQVLLVDLSRNGGGSEWAEAAARIVSPVSLRSAPVGALRSKAWVARWQALAGKLRKTARRASNADRVRLLAFAEQADAIAADAGPCSGVTCSRLAKVGFGSGLVAQLTAAELDGKAWRAEVFSPAQFPYRDSVWEGPVILLVDSETWSAAEQFTALLRDNDAAIVMGMRTGGAGCGHLYDNQPIVLSHSRAALELPNCVRFRRDGSNEVNGIVPDVATGVRANDGPTFAGRLTAAHLPDAIAQAQKLAARQRR